MVRRCSCFPLTCLAMVCALSAALVLVVAPAAAQQGHHGEGHDAMHHWYLTLKDWRGRPCCNDQDCRPTRSRVRGADIEVLLDGEWTKVPAHKILPEESPDLRTHVCSPGRASNYPRGHIFCVVLGSGV